MHGDCGLRRTGHDAETLDFAYVPGYNVGGAIHVIVNNLIGFTTEPYESTSSRFSSDLAKRLPIPIFHVNAEDADAVVRIARTRARISLHSSEPMSSSTCIGYRRHGHSEVDDPTITQPVRYAQASRIIRRSGRLYAKQLGADRRSTIARPRKSPTTRRRRRPQELTKMPAFAQHPAYWDRLRRRPLQARVRSENLHHAGRSRRSTKGLTLVPRYFAIHPKIKKLLEQRAEMGQGKRAIDYGMAEGLAFGSLLDAGRSRPPERPGHAARHLQPSPCGARRHQRRECIHSAPSLAADQAKFEVYNSILSEAACIGFEYGYSRDYPEVARALGSPVRRLRQWRADHHRSVHRRRRRQVGTALRPRPATAARL